MAKHKTIPFDPAAHLAKSLRKPAFKAAYDALEDEFSALEHCCKHANMPD